MAEKPKMPTENDRENLKELGQVKMEHQIHLLSVIGKWKGMSVFPPTQRRPSMSIFCLSLPLLRTAIGSKACWCF